MAIALASSGFEPILPFGYLLVERKEVLKRVQALQHKERGRGNIILMDPLNMWPAELSYVVTRKLDILIMVYVPIAKLESFRHLYKYLRTPLAFTKTSTHFFPNPSYKYLMLDKDNSHPQVLEESELARCKVVRTGFVLLCRFSSTLRHLLVSLPFTQVIL